MIIDSFIVSGEAKWGQTTRLTLLLPHGYEGSGPSTRAPGSSASSSSPPRATSGSPTRPPPPSTSTCSAARPIAKARPLVVFTPKGLLRLPRAGSTLEELTKGEFHFVLDDPTAEDRRDKVERLVLCSGKVYYDIDANPKRAESENVAVARVELLYPFAKEQIALIAHYPNLKEIVWAQEEPRNMGAWSVMSRRLPELIPEGVEFRYVGRPPRASPGEGYAAAHAREQERIVLTALTPGQARAESPKAAEPRPSEAIQAGAGPALRGGQVRVLVRVSGLQRCSSSGSRPALTARPRSSGSPTGSASWRSAC